MTERGGRKRSAPVDDTLQRTTPRSATAAKKKVRPSRRRERDASAEPEDRPERPRKARARRPAAKPPKPAISTAGSRSLLATRMGDDDHPIKLRAVHAKRRRRSKHRLALFFSCHGGTGTTFLSASVATMLARAGRRTCLLDLDLQFGDALAALDLRPRCSISEVTSDETLREGSKVDRDLLLTRLPRHPSGLFVLSQVGDVEGLGDVSIDDLTDLLRQLRRIFEFVIVDGVRDFNDLALTTLDVADTIALVATQDVSTLRGLVLRLEIFKRLGYEPADLRLVVNRFARKSLVPLDAIANSVDLEPSFVVEDDYKLAHRVLNEGRALLDVAPRAQMTLDVALIVEHLFSVSFGNEKAGLLDRLLGGGR